jgi:DNA-binding transcriptional regulator LsrR (DeoR family)
VAALRAEGLTLAQIGERLGVTRQAVSSMLQRTGAKGKQGDT